MNTKSALILLTNIVSICCFILFVSQESLFVEANFGKAITIECIILYISNLFLPKNNSNDSTKST